MRIHKDTVFGMSMEIFAAAAYLALLYLLAVVLR